MPSIGEVARQTGLKIPTIRFYEDERLLKPPPRAANGRRVYSEADVRRLAFIRHARSLGFEMDDIRSLLLLTDRPNQSCAAADEIARRHLSDIDERLAQLMQLKAELSRISRACSGGRSMGECRVIEALAGHDQCVGDHVGEGRRLRKKRT